MAAFFSSPVRFSILSSAPRSDRARRLVLVRSLSRYKPASSCSACWRASVAARSSLRAVRGWLAVLLLPDVNHLVHQRRGDLLVDPTDEVVGVERQLMPTTDRGAPRKAIGREVSVRVCVPLVGDEGVDEGTTE